MNKLDTVLQPIDTMCEHQGCTETSTVPCYLPDDGDTPSFHFCTTHCHSEGFCWGCGQFYAGIETFDFSPDGLCDDCRVQFFREDSEEDEEAGDEWLALWEDYPGDLLEPESEETDG